MGLAEFCLGEIAGLGDVFLVKNSSEKHFHLCYAREVLRQVSVIEIDKKKPVMSKLRGLMDALRSNLPRHLCISCN